LVNRKSARNLEKCVVHHEMWNHQLYLEKAWVSENLRLVGEFVEHHQMWDHQESCSYKLWGYQESEEFLPVTCHTESARGE
jgi:hypothetical protein